MSQKGETFPTVVLPIYDEFKTRRRELSPQKREIIECLESNESMLRPYEIAKMTKINRDSVSARLSELRTLGLVIWRKGGYYELNPLENPTKNQGRGDFSGVCGWRVQNVNLCALVPMCVEDKVRFLFGDISLRISFGSKRGKIFAVVGCGRGLGYGEWLLILDKLEGVCVDRGYVGLEWRVSMCEFLKDHESRRLDGVKGYTLTRFSESVIEKIYGKPGGVVRHERRIHPESMSVDVITSFLSNGLQGMDYAAEIHRVWDAIESLTVAMKYHNASQYERAHELLMGVQR